MFLSRLFHSDLFEGKKEFLKKLLLDSKLRSAFSQFLV